jgi:hypothetical protein
MKRVRLARHLTVVLIIKALALYGLWTAFFSSPSPVDAQVVSDVLVGTDSERKGH